MNFNREEKQETIHSVRKLVQDELRPAEKELRVVMQCCTHYFVTPANVVLYYCHMFLIINQPVNIYGMIQVFSICLINSNNNKTEISGAEVKTGPDLRPTNPEQTQRKDPGVGCGLWSYMGVPRKMRESHWGTYFI